MEWLNLKNSPEMYIKRKSIDSHFHISKRCVCPMEINWTHCIEWMDWFAATACLFLLHIAWQNHKRWTNTNLMQEVVLSSATILHPSPKGIRDWEREKSREIEREREKQNRKQQHTAHTEIKHDCKLAVSTFGFEYQLKKLHFSNALLRKLRTHKRRINKWTPQTAGEQSQTNSTKDSTKTNATFTRWFDFVFSIYKSIFVCSLFTFLCRYCCGWYAMSIDYISAHTQKSNSPNGKKSLFI